MEDWVFKIGQNGQLRAEHLEYEVSVRLVQAAAQRLRGWVSQVSTNYEIQPGIEQEGRREARFPRRPVVRSGLQAV